MAEAKGHEINVPVEGQTQGRQGMHDMQEHEHEQTSLSIGQGGQHTKGGLKQSYLTVPQGEGEKARQDIKKNVHKQDRTKQKRQQHTPR